MPESSVGFSIVGSKLIIYSDASPRVSAQCQPTKAMAGERCFATLTDRWGRSHYLQRAQREDERMQMSAPHLLCSLDTKGKIPRP